MLFYYIYKLILLYYYSINLLMTILNVPQILGGGKVDLGVGGGVKGI